MALSNIAAVGNQGPFAGCREHGHARFDVDMDADYRTNGYLTFTTLVKAALGGALAAATVIDIKQTGPSVTGYFFRWNRATDALRAYSINVGTGLETEAVDHTSLALDVSIEFEMTWN